MKRPFNQSAYDAHDKKNKEELCKIMTDKGYELVGDIEKENFKKYDLKFKHQKTGVSQLLIKN